MAKPLTLLNRFDRLNRRHFKGRLKRPSMVRFSKRPDPAEPSAVGHTRRMDDGQVYVLVHEALRPFPTLVEAVLAHEMAHIWNWERDVYGSDGDCRKRGSRHHKKMLSILKREPWLC